MVYQNLPRARVERAKPYGLSLWGFFPTKRYAFPCEKAPRLWGHTMRDEGATCLFGLSSWSRLFRLSGFFCSSN